MPPKKVSEKAIAAEAKKQNSQKAKDILEQLKKAVVKPKSDGGSDKKPSRKKSEKVVKSNEKPIQAKDIAGNSKRTTRTVSNVQDSGSTFVSAAVMEKVLEPTGMNEGDKKAQ